MMISDFILPSTIGPVILEPLLQLSYKKSIIASFDLRNYKSIEASLSLKTPKP
jgi:hypothetical protein